MDILEKVYCLPNKHVHLLCLFHWFYFEITAKTCYHLLLSELQSHWKDLNLSTAFHPGLNVLKPSFVGSTMLVQHNPTFLVHVTSSNITCRMIISVIYVTFAAAKRKPEKTSSSNIVGWFIWRGWSQTMVDYQSWTGMCGRTWKCLNDRMTNF